MPPPQRLKAEMQNHVQYLRQLKDYDEKIAEEREVRAKEEEQKKMLQVCICLFVWPLCMAVVSSCCVWPLCLAVLSGRCI